MVKERCHSEDHDAVSLKRHQSCLALFTPSYWPDCQMSAELNLFISCWIQYFMIQYQMSFRGGHPELTAL
jgi:hypothetical protein